MEGDEEEGKGQEEGEGEEGEGEGEGWMMRESCLQNRQSGPGTPMTLRLLGEEGEGRGRGGGLMERGRKREKEREGREDNATHCVLCVCFTTKTKSM